MARLRAFFDAVLGEAERNPPFAKALSEALAVSEAARETPKAVQPASASQQDSKLRIPAAGFDPLAVHLEVALLNGREQEAREFLRKLSRSELQEVVQAQRLPGAKALQKAILEAPDPAAMVDDVVASAGQKAKGRLSAAN